MGRNLLNKGPTQAYVLDQGTFAVIMQILAT